MEPSICLRPEVAEDADFLFRLYASTRTEEMKLVPWNAAQKEGFLRMQFQAQTTHYRQYYPDASYDVILCEGKAIGRLYVHRTEDAILVIDIALLPEHRGRAIGSGLLNEILSQASAQKKCVQIHVERNNPALRLYTRLGFQVTEDKGIYYFMEWTPAGWQGAKKRVST